MDNYLVQFREVIFFHFLFSNGLFFPDHLLPQATSIIISQPSDVVAAIK